MTEKTYTPSALEAIARVTLKSFDPSLVTGEPRSTPIEKIAEWLGLAVMFFCLKKDGSILGRIFFEDTYVPIYDVLQKQYRMVFVKRGTIILDESLLHGKNDGRLRFTCAHEIAHWLIHEYYFLGNGCTAALLNPQMIPLTSGKIERQANIIASCLLMPAGQVKKAFYRLSSHEKINARYYLAKLFDVSFESMGIFIEDHNLVL